MPIPNYPPNWRHAPAISKAHNNLARKQKLSQFFDLKTSFLGNFQTFSNLF